MKKLGCEDVVWDLSPLYSGVGDERIEKDIMDIKAKISSFSAKYKGNIQGITPAGLFEAATMYDDIMQKMERISAFSRLNFYTQTDNAEAGAFRQKFDELQSGFNKDILFFQLEWSALDDAAAKPLIEGKEMRDYRHFLEVVRMFKHHKLTEAEEKIIAELEPVGASSWCKLSGKVRSQTRFGKKKRPMEEVLSDLYKQDRDVRAKSADDLTDGLSSMLHVTTHIFNQILADKMVYDKLRKYQKWVSSKNLENDVDDKVVNALIGAVTARWDIIRRYYRLKKKLCGYDTLFDYDLFSPLPFSMERTIKWDEAKRIVISAYTEFSPEVGAIVQNAFDQRWVHAPVAHGKGGGALTCYGTPDTHPYILLNYKGTMKNVKSLAHELGHGVHGYLAQREQKYIMCNIPLVMAETASIFGEMLVFNSLLDNAKTKEEELGLVCTQLENILTAVYKETAMNRFEDAAHNERRDTGELSSERLCALWSKMHRDMFGDSVTIRDDYNVWWSYVPHFIVDPGYVYAYVFGELLVLSLYKMFLKDKKSFVPKYLKLLASGGKESPAKLLSDFGVNIEDPNFWKEGLDFIDELVTRAEKLAGSIS